MIRALGIAAALAVIAGPALAAAPMDSTTAIAKSAQLRPFVSRGESGPLWKAFDQSMRTAMGDSAHFDALLTGLHVQFGAVIEVLSETVAQERGLWVYRARCQFAKVPDPHLLLIAYTPEGWVAGLAVQPEKREEHPSTKLDYQIKTKLELPFRGEWLVIWGGRTLEQNQHSASKSQRFAYDLCVVKDGATHLGDGKKLSDYYCYGAEVLAPAAGKVVWSCDSLPDQQPGRMDPVHPVGNGVVIDHGHGEFSLLAHLQPHSQRLKVGKRVKAGAVLGLCGNSGNTTEPHLHYHLQDGPDISTAEGLPVKFLKLCVDGSPVGSAEPVRGQRVEPCLQTDTSTTKSKKR